MLIDLPIGIHISHGLEIQVNNAPVANAPVAYCVQNGCRASFILSPAHFWRGRFCFSGSLMVQTTGSRRLFRFRIFRRL